MVDSTDNNEIVDAMTEPYDSVTGVVVRAVVIQSPATVYVQPASRSE
ncbi:hypothetical protein ACOZ4F_12155 [Haloarcula marismortui]|nr:hypothetical protein [Haloarcula sp. Atlit-47R]